jgi:hypothetical protein
MKDQPLYGHRNDGLVFWWVNQVRAVNRVKKIKLPSRLTKIPPIVFVFVFALAGSLIIAALSAAPGACTTTDVIGTSTSSVSAPETAQYRLWVRMQVPDNTNDNNTNGVKIEIAGSSSQCFTVTTTQQNAVNQWQWVNSSATAPTTPHITSQITAGNYTAKVLGMKAGVKVDKVILLRQDNTCTPSNDFTNGQPGENCTTPAPTISFSANPTSVVSGNGSTLNWSTTNASACTSSGSWTGSRATAGNFSTGNLTASQTYTLTCTGPGGSANQSVTVTVTPPPAPTVTLTANPTSVLSGNPSTLTWSSTNATSCTANGSWSGSRPTSGNASTGNLIANQSYTLSCSGPGGNASASVTVTITTTPPVSDTTQPTVTMVIPGVTLTAGQTTTTVNNIKTLTWQPLVSDASGIKSTVYSVNNQTVTLTSGSVSVGQTNGDYELKVVATDNADNVTTSTLIVRVRHPDFNRSGRVDIFDLNSMLNRWGQQSSIYDINVNNKVDIFDLTFLLNRWNSTQ